MPTITVGRKPTLGEVLDYYTREDFLTFMLSVLERHRVVTVIPETLHWEPNWKRDEVTGATVAELRDLVVAQVTEALPDVGRDERPDYYPSFHRSVWWRAEPGERRGKDCVFEADLPTWRDAFRDVGAAITLMERHGVRYRHKFSGHRSLHIVLPAGLLPRGYRGKSAQKLALHITRWSGAQAHVLPKITRMPYSLNEDTGLVCLPIARGELAAFRPWRANLHRVTVRGEAWHEALTSEDAANFAAFLEAIETHEPDVDARYFIPDTRGIAQAARRPVADAAAWSPLTAEAPLSEPALRAALDAPEPDVRWLAIEAYLLHGTGLSPKTVRRLLAESEEYTQVAAVDVLLRFEDDVFPLIVEMAGDLHVYSPAGAQAAYLLAQSDSLRHKVIDALVAAADPAQDAPRDVLLASACMVGAMAGDWPSAFDILAPLEGAEDLSKEQQQQMEALHLISEMGTRSRHDGAHKAQQLAQLGPGVTDLVLLAAGSPNRHLRRDLTAALAELADPRSVDLLISALADNYSRVRRKAIPALIRIGEPAVAPLIAALASDQSRIRRSAVRCLGRIGAIEGLAERVKPAIMQTLDDSEEIVRRQAIRALRDIVTPEDLDRLVHFIQEATWENGKEVAKVMGGVGEAGREALEALALREHVLPAAAYYLASQGDVRGGDLLAELLHADDPVRQNAAVDLLAELADPRAVPYIAARLMTLTHWRAMWYARQLGEIGTPEAVDALLAALDREHTLARRGAVRALGVAQDPRSAPHLVQHLSDPDGKTRNEARDALIAIGEPAIEPLLEDLERETLAARQRSNRVKHILGKLGVET
jgi:HEAT repeat protein